jgi:hypothetical protein
VLFLAPGALAGPDGTIGPAAVVSRSNRQLRQALDAAGADYVMASAAGGGGAGGGSSGDGSREQRQLGQAPSAADGRAGSQLLLRGGRGVQALYLLLQQQPWCAAEAGGDVPLLLAPAPFAGGALCPCTLKVWLRAVRYFRAWQSRLLTQVAAPALMLADRWRCCAPREPAAACPPLPPTPQELSSAPGAGMRRGGSVLGAGAGPAQQHYAELGSSVGGGDSSGLLVAPWTLARLSALLAESQAEFEVFTDAEATSSSLNLCADLDTAWQRGQAEGAGGGVGGEERAAWGPSCLRLAGRYVKQLRFSGGAFDARLAAP